MKLATPKAGAVAMVLAAAAYMVLSLATGRSARAEAPPDLAPGPDAALDVWKTAAALAQDERAALLDLRPADAYARYHLPGALSRPGAGPGDVKALLETRSPVIVYAGKDEVAQKLVAQVRQAVPAARVHYLADGARAWYLAFQLPVPLFSESPPPDGYQEAVQQTTAFFQNPAASERPRVVEALQTLARLNYQPGLLKSGKKAAAAGGGKKKIGGGCG